MEPRIEVTPSGARRTVYRRKEIRPGDPEYEKELKAMMEYFKTKTGQKYFTPRQMTFTPAVRKI